MSSQPRQCKVDISMKIETFLSVFCLVVSFSKKCFFLGHQVLIGNRVCALNLINKFKNIHLLLLLLSIAKLPLYSVYLTLGILLPKKETTRDRVNLGSAPERKTILWLILRDGRTNDNRRHYFQESPQFHQLHLHRWLMSDCCSLFCKPTSRLSPSFWRERPIFTDHQLTWVEDNFKGRTHENLEKAKIIFQELT